MSGCPFVFLGSPRGHEALPVSVGAIGCYRVGFRELVRLRLTTADRRAGQDEPQGKAESMTLRDPLAALACSRTMDKKKPRPKARPMLLGYRK
jgi:hypothetical protein